MKIRNKLALTYLNVSLFALMIISAFFYFYVRGVLATEVTNHLESVASIQKHRIEGIITQNLERIDLVSSRTQLRISLQKYLDSNKLQDLDKLKLIIKDALVSIGSFNVISILDKAGYVIVSTEPSRVSRDYSQYTFYPHARKKNSAEHFFLDEKNGLQLYLSGPLLMDGLLIGVLLIEADATNFVTLVNDFSGLGKTGEMELGRLSDDKQYVELLTPVRFDKNAALHRRIGTDQNDSPMVNVLSKTKLAGSAIDYRGEKVLAATRYIYPPGWGLVVKLDEDAALQPAHVLVKYMTIIAFGAMLIVMWVSYALASIISKPIVELTKVAHGINEGDLSHRAQVRSDDEVGELANTFNNMTNTLIHSRQDIESSNRELHAHRDHLEELVSMRTRELQTIIDELEAFSYSVSHDLRSPLRAIDGYSYLLMEHYEQLLDEDGKENFKRIRLAAQRMGALIDDLLKLAHINRSDIIRENVDMSAKVNTTINRIVANNVQRNVEFIVQPDVHAYVDDALMEIVVENLIDNAWKYTEKKSEAKIEFGTMIQDDQTVYYIRDNGVGFDMQYADKMFGAFQRLVGNDEYPGTGIGLATVSRVIHRHGGKIWAEGQPERGASFFFTVSQS